MICDDCKNLKVWATEKGKIKRCEVLGSVKTTSNYCAIWSEKEGKKKQPHKTIF